MALGNFSKSKSVPEKIKKKIEPLKDMEIKKWKVNQTKIYYQLDTVDKFKSLRDILKKRVQFNKAEQVEHERIQKKYINKAMQIEFRPEVVSTITQQLVLAKH